VKTGDAEDETLRVVEGLKVKGRRSGEEDAKRFYRKGAKAAKGRKAGVFSGDFYSQLSTKNSQLFFSF